MKREAFKMYLKPGFEKNIKSGIAKYGLNW